MAEAGVPGYEVYEWNAISRAVQSPEFRERVAALGGELTGYGPAEAERFVRTQTELWGKVVRDGNVKAE